MKIIRIRPHVSVIVAAFCAIHLQLPNNLTSMKLTTFQMVETNFLSGEKNNIRAYFSNNPNHQKKPLIKNAKNQNCDH